MPIGSPSSPLLAEIFMDYFEGNILKSINLFSITRCWARYVDIIMILNGSERQLNLFFNELNSKNKNIQFTIEIDGNYITFLEYEISIVNNQWCCDIFRKSTFEDRVTPLNSNHPYNTKLSRK